MYIVFHTKGLAGYFTSFFFYRPSFLLNTTFSTSFVSLGPTGAWPLPCAAAFPHSIGFLQLLYHLLQHGVDTRIHWLGNPMQAPPICKSRLQSEANHECIAGVGE